MQKGLKIDKAVELLTNRKNALVAMNPNPYQFDEYNEIINALLILRGYSINSK